MLTAYLALGANLGDPAGQIEAAVENLRRPGCRPLRRARLYVSKPVGPQDQPDFVNTVVEVETNLAPLDLLDAAAAVERDLGRERGERWGPRVIDVDIALYEDVIWRDDRLTIPHAELCRRSFVLQPLADLCPGRVVPGTGRTVATWAAEVTTPEISPRSEPVKTYRS